MPQLADLQKRVFHQPTPTEVSADHEETLVTDYRALLTPSQMVEAKFWAALSAVRQPRSTSKETPRA